MTRAALLLVLVAGCLDLESGGKFRKNPEFLVVGHRGAPNAAAENTIAALDAALGLGARGVEVDLCLTADGEVVVWHDRDPDDLVAQARQEGVEGLLYVPWVPPAGSPLRRPVDELLLADFLASHGYTRDVGASAPDAGAPIAVLADLATWTGRAAAGKGGLRAVYLDVKVAAGQTQAAAAIVDEAAAALPPAAGLDVYLLSPHRDIVEGLQARVAASGRGDLHPVWDFESDGALAGARALGLRHVTLGLTPTRTESEVLGEVDELLAARARKELDSVVVWTIDSPRQIGVMLFHGVDGLFSNEPGLLYDLWQASLE